MKMSQEMLALVLNSMLQQALSILLTSTEQYSSGNIV